MPRLTLRRGDGPLLMVLGAALLVGSIVGYGYARHALAVDAAGLEDLRQLIAQRRTELTHAATAADSVRLTTELKERDFYFAQRAFHIPMMQSGVRAWWRPPSAGAMVAIVGALVIAFGVRQRLRPPEHTSALS